MKIVYPLLFLSAFLCLPAPVKTRLAPTIEQSANSYPEQRHGGPIATGPSGALNCVDFGPGVCDVVTAVVPLKASTSTIAGAWTFAQLRLAVYNVKALPPCSEGLEGQMAGVKDAKTVAYNEVPEAGGKSHVPVYCNGTAWVMH